MLATPQSPQGAALSPHGRRISSSSSGNNSRMSGEFSVSSPRRVLNFCEPPAPPLEESSGGGAARPTEPRSPQKLMRQIPSAPSRILDAPDIVDDYYLNLISWSSANVLAVALGPSVYLWNAGNIKKRLFSDGRSSVVLLASCSPSLIPMSPRVKQRTAVVQAGRHGRGHVCLLDAQRLG